VLLDKTGTVTTGEPVVERVVAFDGVADDEVLRLAASLDQLSAHVIAEALVGDAVARGFDLSTPSGVVEDPGSGIAGCVDEHVVTVGSARWLRRRGYSTSGSTLALPPGTAPVLVGVDGTLAGALVMTDRLRPDAAAAVDRLHRGGVDHVAMVSGDRAAIARRAGHEIGVDQVYAERSPEGKLAIVDAMHADARRRQVVMVGDGVNDAPALALADVGIAMGTTAATASSETADAVITVPRIDRVADAVDIGRRSLGIARQSVLVGMGLSLVAMGFAAAGLIVPLAGAILQEGIDVAVILNALRALRG
jgi:P-type E1-E2 ATPase